MPRERASVAVERPKLLGVLFRRAFLCANPYSCGSADAPRAPRAMSIREAARHAGISAPALLSILRGERRRLSMGTAVGLWRLWRTMKRRGMREVAPRTIFTDGPSIESVRAKIRRLRRQIAKSEHAEFERSVRIDLLDSLMDLHTELKDHLVLPTVAAVRAASRRAKVRQGAA